VCSICDPAESRLTGSEYGFRSHVDLAAHMQRIHREVTGNRKIEINQFIKQSMAAASSSDASRNVPFVDLDFSSADPNLRWRHQASSSSTEASSAATSAANAVNMDDYDYNFPSATRGLIPENMRIAGRITGTGRFKLTPEDEAMQAEADSRGVVDYRKLGKMQSSMAATEFPQLAPTNNCEGEKTASSSGKLSDTQSLLSIVGRKSPAISAGAGTAGATAATGELVSRCVQRTDVVFGLLSRERAVLDQPSRELLDSWIAHGDGLSSRQPNLTKLLEAFQKPLYSFDMLHWAKKNKFELAKFEKRCLLLLSHHVSSLMQYIGRLLIYRMYDLISDKNQTSVQLKPMISADRAMIHGEPLRHQFRFVLI
jgi:hypothetical protein